MQNFCGNCGSRLREGARFCAVCGEPAGRYASRCELSFSARRAAPRPGLMYAGIHPRAVLAPLAVVFGALALYIFQLLYRNGLFDFERIKGLFTDFTAASWLQRLPEMLGRMAFTALVMYVPVNSMCGFFHGMGSGKACRVSIFGGLRLCLSVCGPASGSRSSESPPSAGRRFCVWAARSISCTPPSTCRRAYCSPRRGRARSRCTTSFWA